MSGYIFLKKNRNGKAWHGRWYRQEVNEQGIVVRVQHSEKLCDYGDRYRRRKDVEPLLAAKLRPENEGRCAAESTLPISKYAETFFFPYAESELKPSTVHGYRALWRTYLEPHLGKVNLRDFTCGQATKLLTDIHREHGLSRKSLRHCKALLSVIFTHAKRADVISGENPIADAGIPRAAVAAKKTHAYNPSEIAAMLEVLPAIAKAALALQYFCGLRPGEARAVRWENVDLEKRVLRVSHSMWRTHITAPKTEESCGLVPVAEALADILMELPRTSEFILAGPSGKPLDLHNLAARVVVPSLERCAVCHEMKSNHEKAGHDFALDEALPQWKGWYACRRGCATLATSVDSALAAKSLLRHANIQTTAADYIKSVPAEAVRAVDKINALFDNASVSGKPN